MTISSISDERSQVQIQESTPVAAEADIAITSRRPTKPEPPALVTPDPGSMEDQISKIDLEKLLSNMNRFEGELVERCSIFCGPNLLS